jgi:catechol 2,3-dioxygenase-like lactoylglutathione lyase family enzyme
MAIGEGSDEMDFEAVVQDLRSFLPAQDFKTSREFYTALGFQEVWSSDNLALFQLGRFTFFLQDFFVKDFAENIMMDLRVSDADAFWSHLEHLNLPQRFQRVRIGAPQDDKATGIRRGHFIDPSGILWHFSHAVK